MRRLRRRHRALLYTRPLSPASNPSAWLPKPLPERVRRHQCGGPAVVPRRLLLGLVNTHRPEQASDRRARPKVAPPRRRPRQSPCGPPPPERLAPCVTRCRCRGGVWSRLGRWVAVSAVGIGVGPLLGCSCVVGPEKSASLSTSTGLLPFVCRLCRRGCTVARAGASRLVCVCAACRLVPSGATSGCQQTRWCNVRASQCVDLTCPAFCLGDTSRSRPRPVG